jgi:20S proteasome alpha/beta subunit
MMMLLHTLIVTMLVLHYTVTLMLVTGAVYGKSGYLEQVEYAMNAASSRGSTMVALRNDNVSVIAVWSPRRIRRVRRRSFSGEVPNDTSRVGNSKDNEDFNEIRILDRNLHVVPNGDRDTAIAISYVGLPIDCDYLHTHLMRNYLSENYIYGEQTCKTPSRIAQSLGADIHSMTIPSLARPLCVRSYIQGYDKGEKMPVLYELDCLGNVHPRKSICVGKLLIR